MAVVLNNSTEAVHNFYQLFEKISAAPASQEAQFFNRTIDLLNNNVNCYAALTPIARLPLSVALSWLEAVKMSAGLRLFTLRTEWHVMLVGRIRPTGDTDQKDTFVFFDPNFCLVFFSNVNVLKDTIVSYFKNPELTSRYGLLTSSKDHTEAVFEVEEISASKLGFIDVGRGLSLHRVLTVEKISPVQKEFNFVQSRSRAAAASSALPDADQYTAAATTRAFWLAQNFKEEVERLVLSFEEKDLQWVPILATLRREGNDYTLQFISSVNTDLVTQVETQNPIFALVKDYIEQSKEEIEQMFTLTDGGFVVRGGAARQQRNYLVNLGSAFETFLEFSNSERPEFANSGRSLLLNSRKVSNAEPRLTR